MIKILELKEDKNPSTWIEGYKENDWREIQNLENGEFIENDDEIYFIPVIGEKIGYTKDFLDQRTNEIVTYATYGGVEIIKHLNNPGIFEIITRTGHYCKLMVESNYVQSPILIPYYKITLTKNEIEMLSQGFNQDFLPRYDSQEVFFEKNSEGDFDLYFRFIATIENQLNYYYNNGTLSRGDNYLGWIKIKIIFDNAEKLENISHGTIEKLKKYNHQNFL